MYARLTANNTGAFKPKVTGSIPVRRTQTSRSTARFSPGELDEVLNLRRNSIKPA